MLPSIVSGVLSWFGGLLSKLTALFLARQSGKESQRLENAEETLSDVEKINRIADDDSYDHELFEKYRK